MGSNSWYELARNVGEKLVRGTDDAMITSGMKQVGYEYIVIDDCWGVSRDATGKIVADPERFPSGIAGLADYLHSKGLKLGICSDAGTETCAGRRGEGRPAGVSREAPAVRVASATPHGCTAGHP